MISVQNCASRMIIEGYWHERNHTDSNIRKAWPEWAQGREEWIAAAKHYRDTGVLFPEICRQLDGLCERNNMERA